MARNAVILAGGFLTIPLKTMIWISYLSVFGFTCRIHHGGFENIDPTLLPPPQPFCSKDLSFFIGLERKWKMAEYIKNDSKRKVNNRKKLLDRGCC
jgi:hypothetical protein